MVSILIVNWNTCVLLRACLTSLRDHCDFSKHEIIVLDNASGDGSAQMVAAEFPEVQLIPLNENIGFAAGNNRAYQAASGDHIWLLNPDTEIFSHTLERMVNFLADNPRAGGVASALIDAQNGQIQRSCRTFPTPVALWAQSLGLARAFRRSKRFGFYKMGWWSMKTARQVEQPMASSFMLRRRAIEEAGSLFDEAFPIFFNDVDLCYRLIQAKWEIWFLPDAHVKHWGGAATSQLGAALIAESHRSLRLFYEKWYRSKFSPLIYWPTVAMFETAGRARQIWAKRKRATT